MYRREDDVTHTDRHGHRHTGTHTQSARWVCRNKTSGIFRFSRPSYLMIAMEELIWKVTQTLITVSNIKDNS